LIAPGAQLTDLGCGWLAGLDLRGADLSHANLDGVDLTDTLLDCATLDDTTLHWVGAFVARGRPGHVQDACTCTHACGRPLRGEHLLWEHL